MLFEITYERFLEEMRMTEGPRNPVEVEEFGDMLIFYLSVDKVNKTYATVIAKNQITDVQRSNLMAKPVLRRINDTQTFNNIQTTLTQIEEKIKKIPQIK